MLEVNLDEKEISISVLYIEYTHLHVRVDNLKLL